MIKYAAILAAILAGISGVWFHGVSMGEKTNQLKHEQEINLLNVKADKVARKNQEAIDDVLRTQSVVIADINRQHSIDITRLRDRPERVPATSPGTECKGGTGADLSRPDSEFLVGEAARADTIRVGLIACYTAYDAID